MVYRDGREDLLLRLAYSVSPAGPEGNPAIRQMGWVVPVPALPDSYGRIAPEVFNEVNGLFPVQPGPRAGSFGGGLGGSAQTLEVLPAVVEGEYVIQPLKTHGAEGVRELAGWVASNQFEPLPTRGLRYYAQQRWTFLAIRVNPPRGQLAGSGTLPALRISFPSPYLSFPMMLSGSQAPVALYVLTARPLPQPDMALRAFGFRLRGARQLRRPLAPQHLGELWDTGALAKQPGGFLYSFWAPSADSRSWKFDLYLKPP